MKNKPFIIFTFTAALLFFFLSNSILGAQTPSKRNEKTRLELMAKFAKVLSYIENNAVDQHSMEELINKSIAGLLSNLDPHSAFLSKTELKRFTEQTSGHYGGLGMYIGLKERAIVVIAPIDDTPAQKAGLKAGDKIIKVNDINILGASTEKASSLMKGKPGTQVQITVIREGADEPLVFNLMREIIRIKSVDTKKIEGGLLYIRVKTFDLNVVETVEKALKNYAKDKSIKDKGIVLDLRNNPGGIYSQAVGLIDLFVSKGVISVQKGRRKKDDIVYKANLKTAISTKIPLTILVNAGSASASEIVSGGLQDLKRGVIVGEKTFGKGSVQTIIPLNKDEAIKLTIARYYLPSGRTIQAVGITPNIEIGAGEVRTFKNVLSIKEKDLKDHLVNEQETKQRKSKKEQKSVDITRKDLLKDIQLKTAVDILKALNITK